MGGVTFLGGGGGGSVDMVARMGLVVGMFNDLADHGATGQPLGFGFVDEFEDDTGLDMGASTGMIVGGGFVSNASLVATQSPASGSQSAGWGAGYTCVDRSYAVPNSSTIQQVGVYQDAAISLTVQLVERTGGGAYTVLAEATLEHTGSGWEDVALPSPYATAATGEFFVAVYSAATLKVSTSVHDRGYKAGLFVGSVTGVTDNNQAVVITRVWTGAGGGGDATLISTAQTAASTPANGDFVCLLEEVDAVTLGTDLQVFLSQDGGTTWAEVSLEDYGDFDTGVAVLAGSVTPGGSGTSIKWKVETSNSKEIKLHAAGVLWE